LSYIDFIFGHFKKNLKWKEMHILIATVLLTVYFMGTELDEAVSTI